MEWSIDEKSVTIRQYGLKQKQDLRLCVLDLRLLSSVDKRSEDRAWVVCWKDQVVFGDDARCRVEGNEDDEDGEVRLRKRECRGRDIRRELEG
jgi:hypothetical protein